ncbi:head-tail connector protein [Tritonibacter horizontis]|uniref:Phage gp6-like head-tail connector protein n=1 Tax=Tritonibacter horizontis TaxID=1768241 RepID=A0A132BUB0_9RHOB|nr:hypothetical protein [Tritonibacter horizontis]KUP91796.1 hypothetical protein TRIHO_33270 [Tritonibacter horizontis]
MALTLIPPPVSTPVDLAQLRAHLRLEEGDDTEYLQHCLDVAIAQFDGDDGELGRALIAQSWRESFPWVPAAGGSVELSLSPVSSVLKVEVFNLAGDWDEVPGSAVELFEVGGRSYVSAAAWPRPGRQRAPLRIEYVAGYGAAASAVPRPIGHAILLFAAHLYKAREPVVFDAKPVEVPLSISRLVANYKTWWR